MMTKGRIGRVFALEAEERLPVDSREPPDQLPVPTLDERVNLYLRAVHGKRDFTSGEVSEARNFMLDAMAADIAAKPQINFPEQPRVSTTPSERPRFDKVIATAALSSPVDYQSNVQYQASEFARSSAMLSHRANLSVARPAREVETVLPRAFIPPRSDAVGPPPALRKIAMRSFQFCAAAVGAGVVALLLVTILPTTTTKRVETAVSPSPVLPAQLATRAKETTLAQQLGPDEIALLQLGRGLIAAGDISSARLVLNRAAEAGSAPAALELGRTYDPIVLEGLEGRAVPGNNTKTRAATPLVGVVSNKAPDVTIVPDIAMARNWYQKARDLGSTEAAERLERLAGRDGQAVPPTSPPPPGPTPLMHPDPNR
jgi:hypothetical protein